MIKLGDTTLKALEYGIQGSAILGIKESGKSYTATMLAERLMDAGIPIIAFDPIGIWHNLRVPGERQGYHVVVAGGAAADLPLTVQTAPEIVRAAMRNGMSLVIDLFDLKLSKSDWRRIVRASVSVLLHENREYGMRHVFIEEAAEFVPQKVMDGETYAEVEKLCRMGGNSRLGYTLISPRSQEVNKAVLELCENMFLFRQRGKNALENMDKWLSIAGAEQQKAIISSLPDMPQGECWAWLGGDKPQPPVRVKMPRKNSFHPDRRMMRADIVEKRKPVDVAKFVETLKGSIEKFKVDADASDPAKLKAEIARLTKELTAKRVDIDPAAIDRAEKRGYDEGYKVGRDVGYRQASRTQMLRVADALVGASMLHGAGEAFEEAAARIKAIVIEDETPMPVALAVKPIKREVTLPAKTQVSSASVSGVEQRILDALYELEVMGVAQPEREIVSFLAGYSNIRSKGFVNALGALRSGGYVDYPDSGKVCLVAPGRAAASEPSTVPTTEAIRQRIVEMLGGASGRILDPLIAEWPNGMDRDALGEIAGYSNVRSKGFVNALGRLRTLGFVEYPSPGRVRAGDLLFPTRG